MDNGNEYPKQRHIDCQNNRCEICRDDSFVLQEYLCKRTGMYQNDTLGMYHSWMKKEGIEPETEYGWWTREAFNKHNIDAFCKRYEERNEEEQSAHGYCKPSGRLSVPASFIDKVRELEEAADEHISNNDCYAQELRKKMYAVREALAEIDKGE